MTIDHDAGEPRFERRSLGNIELCALSDGFTSLEPRLVFYTATDEERRKLFGAAEQIALPINVLLIESEGRRLLVDTGFETGMSENAGRLASSLALVGVDAKEIDTVVLTHGHLDHITGVSNDTGALAFPLARHLISAAEADFWSGPGNYHGNEWMELTMRRKLEALAPRLELLEGETEIAPGVRAIPAPGHTIGHLALHIQSGGHELYAPGDVFNAPQAVSHPDWLTMYEMLPTQARHTRSLWLERLGGSNTLVFMPHAPFPGFGRIEKDSRGHTWRPL